MKVKLYAKKPSKHGYSYLDTVDIPEGKYEWRIPVNQPISVVGNPSVLVAPSVSTTAIRVFRRHPHPLFENDVPHFYEE